MSLLNDPSRPVSMKPSNESRPIRRVTTARTESSYQTKLIKKYKEEGWHVLKLIQLNKGGYPDLLLLKPNQVKFVEVKAKNGRLSKIQKYRIDELINLGFDVEVAKSED